MTDNGRTELTSHGEAEELLPWYANGQLDEADRAIVDAHLSSCAYCRQQLAIERRLIKEFQAIEPKIGEKTVNIFDDPGQAFANAMSRAGGNDRIVVFGSFLTVAGVMAAKKSSLH